MNSPSSSLCLFFEINETNTMIDPLRARLIHAVLGTFFFTLSPYYLPSPDYSHTRICSTAS